MIIFVGVGATGFVLAVIIVLLVTGGVSPEEVILPIALLTPRRG